MRPAAAAWRTVRTLAATSPRPTASSSRLRAPQHHHRHRPAPPPSRAMATAAAAAAAAPRAPLLLERPVRLACVQLASGADKAANLAHARDKVAEAAAGGARIVVLPECFNSPYGCDYFPAYAEPLPRGPGAPAPAPDRAPSFHALSAMARDTGTYLFGGSIPEVEVAEAEAEAGAGAGAGAARHYYNTALVFGPDGALLAKHRKVHLFDIDIPGGITFRESDVLSPGDSVTVVDLPGLGRVGLAICYDVRFPELAAVAARRGCFALVYPGAFNLTTGPLHWQLLARGRAVDNQVYVAMCSPARDPAASYRAWGHSLIVDPMARVLVEADDAEAIVAHELDGTVIEDARKGIPLRDQRRFDVYPDVSQGAVRVTEDGQK